MRPMSFEEHNIFSFIIAPEIIFGNGAAEKAGIVAKNLGAKRALIITDKAILGAKLLKEVLASLSKDRIEVEIFAEVEAEPSLEMADDAGDRARKCTLVIGIGGGSSMDVAKTAAILARNGGKARDYEGIDKVPRPGVPKIMIPTTAGSGSELTFTAVLVDKSKHKKLMLHSAHLFAEVAIFDPLLTLSMPPSVTSSTGIDALTHAIEAYVSLRANVITDTLALQAIKLIAENLGQSFRKGSNLIARENMLMGSLLATMAFRNAGLGAVHALAHPLGQICDIAHGVANGILLPRMMEFNSESSPGKYARIAQAMGKNVDGLLPHEASKRAISAVSQLLHDVKIPRRIRDIFKEGLTPDEIERIASSALEEVRYFLENNPKRLILEDAMRIYSDIH
jgi:alcohol dehydrogenase